MLCLRYLRMAMHKSCLFAILDHTANMQLSLPSFWGASQLLQLGLFLSLLFRIVGMVSVWDRLRNPAERELRPNPFQNLCWRLPGRGPAGYPHRECASPHMLVMFFTVFSMMSEHDDQLSSCVRPYSGHTATACMFRLPIRGLLLFQSGLSR